ncbi:MAG TPA: hypothetical protein DFS52_00090 [Myxococcales bacterium]|nr:hypothetical protein [Myxococcales bacterium]
MNRLVEKLDRSIPRARIVAVRGRLVDAGDEDEGNLASLGQDAHAPGDLEAVQRGQQQVEDDHVDLLLREGLQGPLAILFDHHREALGGQGVGKQALDGAVVVDD